MSFYILIVEDDARTRLTIENICKDNSYFENSLIRQVDNGLSAWEQIQLQIPDLLFLDIEMPGITGIELLDKLIVNEIHLNIIIISGYDGYEYTRKAIQYGTVDYLLKPINRKQMHQLLDPIALKLRQEKPRIDLSSSIAERVNSMTSIDMVKKYIDQNYAAPLSLTSLSEQFHYSREHLSREFKNQYGIGLIKYINDVRLERARALLSKSTPVNEVCTRVGFFDDSYFIKIFKHKYGMSPKKYSMNIK